MISVRETRRRRTNAMTFHLQAAPRLAPQPRVAPNDVPRLSSLPPACPEHALARIEDSANLKVRTRGSLGTETRRKRPSGKRPNSDSAAAQSRLSRERDQLIGPSSAPREPLMPSARSLDGFSRPGTSSVHHGHRERAKCTAPGLSLSLSLSPSPELARASADASHSELRGASRDAPTLYE